MPAPSPAPDRNPVLEVHDPNTRRQLQAHSQMTNLLTGPTTTIRALQLGERIDVKGLEREDAFSKNPLAFRTASGGTVVLFKSGAAVFAAMTPPEEEALIDSLMPRVEGPLTDRESETAHLVIRADADDLLSGSGSIQLRALDPDRLLLVAEALATSVAMSYDERRIALTKREPAP